MSGHQHGHGHAHGFGADRPAEAHRARLWAAFGVLAVFVVVEVVGAVLTGSLALLSDAGHAFTDVIGIGLSLAALHVAARGRLTPKRTFGTYRLEVLAALANAGLLLAVATFVLVEAVRRFGDPPDVPAGPMAAVAAAGLAANVVAFLLLRPGSSGSIVLRGAYLEVFADLLGSIGVLVAAGVLQVTGWRYADPVVAVAIAAFVLPRTIRLAWDALRILLQAAPVGVDTSAVSGTLADVDGVLDVHDVHVWTLTSGMDVASAHLTISDGSALAGVLTAARDRLHADYGIEHATLQVEPVGCDGPCKDARW